MDRYGLEYYYKKSLEPGYLAVILGNGSDIAGVALVIVGIKVLTVEMLAKNLETGESRVGPRLLNCVETCIADQLGINRIRLDSLNRKRLIEFYRSRGFVNEGPAVRDRVWGILQPMYKWVAGVSG